MSRIFDAASLACDAIRALSPYTPGFQPKGEGWIKLNTNQAFYGSRKFPAIEPLNRNMTTAVCKLTVVYR